MKDNSFSRFTHRWSRSLGKTQRQLLDEVTSEEITEAMAFERLEPSDMWLMVAFICYVIASFSGTKTKFTVKDFYLPDLQESKSSTFDKAKAVLIQAAAKEKAKRQMRKRR